MSPAFRLIDINLDHAFCDTADDKWNISFGICIGPIGFVCSVMDFRKALTGKDRFRDLRSMTRQALRLPGLVQLIRDQTQRAIRTKELEPEDIADRCEILKQLSFFCVDWLSGENVVDPSRAQSEDLGPCLRDSFRILIEQTIDTPDRMNRTDGEHRRDQHQQNGPQACRAVTKNRSEYSEFVHRVGSKIVGVC
ncbi:hypothetical protein [Fulvimarina sp. MAC8]|uniref:hypothetical protein n=1 Tax=Fulvimarina sp. MAC8 TaxID=3162874 RepID=UPI0032EEF572